MHSVNLPFRFAIFRLDLFALMTPFNKPECNKIHNYIIYTLFMSVSSFWINLMVKDQWSWGWRRVYVKRSNTELTTSFHEWKITPSSWPTLGLIIQHVKLNLYCTFYWLYLSWNSSVNSTPPGQNGRYFSNDTFKRFFLNENVRISIRISMKFVRKSPIEIKAAFVQAGYGLAPTKNCHAWFVLYITRE